MCPIRSGLAANPNPEYGLLQLNFAFWLIGFHALTYGLFRIFVYI